MHGFVTPNYLTDYTFSTTIKRMSKILSIYQHFQLEHNKPYMFVWQYIMSVHFLAPNDCLNGLCCIQFGEISMHAPESQALRFAKRTIREPDRTPRVSDHRLYRPRCLSDYAARACRISQPFRVPHSRIWLNCMNIPLIKRLLDSIITRCVGGRVVQCKTS